MQAVLSHLDGPRDEGAAPLPEVRKGGGVIDTLRLAAALGAFVVLAALARACDDSGPRDPPPYYEERTMDGPRP